jgi:RimJ/RimL family protein N-acetyltransferase
VVPALNLRSAVTAADRAFIVDMARHACVIEDWPLPDADSEDVTSLLPRGADVTVIAADPDTGIDVGAVWTFHHHPPLVTRNDGKAVPEVAIAVTPARRGRGVGAALLEALIDRCTNVHPAVALNVHRRNPAQRLYERRGLRLAGQGRGELGVAMVADLTAPPTVDDSSTVYRPMAYSMTTDRLRLDLRTEDDAEWNCELLAEHANPTTHSLFDMRRRLGEQRIRALQVGIGLLTIRRRSDDLPLGYCGLIIGRCSIDEPEIVIELLRRHNGHGYATESAQAVTDAALATGRTRIWATVASWNAPSLAVCRRLGFRDHHSVTEDDGGEVIHLIRERTA